MQNDGFKQRRHQFVGRGADLLQTVDVGLGKYAALASDPVQLDAVVSLLAELFHGNFELGVDLVDDCAGSAGAFVIHGRNFLLAAGFLIVLENDNFGILPAELDDGIHFGMHLLDRQRNRRDFLHELRADLLGDGAATGAGHEHARIVAIDADLRLHALEKLQRLLRLLGFVALIVLPKDLVGCGIDDHRLHRGRAHVQPDHELAFMVVRFQVLLRFWLRVRHRLRVVVMRVQMIVHSVLA